MRATCVGRKLVTPCNATDPIEQHNWHSLCNQLQRKAKFPQECIVVFFQTELKTSHLWLNCTIATKNCNY